MVAPAQPYVICASHGMVVYYRNLIYLKQREPDREGTRMEEALAWMTVGVRRRHDARAPFCGACLYVVVVAPRVVV